MSTLSESQKLILHFVLSEEAILGIMVFSQDGKTCLYANKLARELLEIPLDVDLKSIEINSLIPKKVRPEFRPLSNDLLLHEGLYQDVAIQKQSNTYFISNLGLKKIKLENIDCVAIMFQDITVQKKLQRDITAKQIEIKAAFEELLKQNQQLKELDLAKNRFIALTTHELRTPLSAMVASAEILKLALYDNEEQRVEFQDMIYEQGQHLMALVNDILDFAKIQAGKLDLYIQQSDLVKTMISLTESFVSMAEGSKITINILPKSLPKAICFYDALRIKQVISNLMTNAIKYNKEGGIINVWIEEETENILLFVEDTGKGISEEDQTKVFNEFETLGKVALHHKGTGLGMPITKQIMKALGGNIFLKSTVNVGTTFWISIPKTQVLDPSNYRERPESIDDLAA